VRSGWTTGSESGRPEAKGRTVGSEDGPVAAPKWDGLDGTLEALRAYDDARADERR
jgi:hypothetical protein